MHRFVMFSRVIMVIAVTEVAVMSILRFIQLPQGFGEDLANAGLLIVLSAPVLYFWVAREMGSALADEHMRDFLDTGPDLVQSVDPQGHFLYVNQSWLKTLGYSRDEVSRLSMFDVIHPDHQHACKIIFERILSGEAVENIETAFVAKDGRSVIASGNINCRFKDGKPVATQGIFGMSSRASGRRPPRGKARKGFACCSTPPPRESTESISRATALLPTLPASGF